MEKLTEDNITVYGFTPCRTGTKDWVSYVKHDVKLGISICKVTEHGFVAGSWYYGSDNIRIETVEELKSLYKLVTKRDLNAT